MVLLRFARLEIESLSLLCWMGEMARTAAMVEIAE